MFGVGLSCLGPYLVEGNAGAIFADIDLKETWKQSLATALTLLGAMISALGTSIPANALGNRKMLIINSFVWIVGGLFCLPYNLYTFFIGRFISGIGVGFSSTLAPVLLAEISHTQQRGIVTSMHQVSITFGIVVMGIASYWMCKIQHGWWWMNSIFFIVIGVVMVITGFAIPDSPLWLLKNHRDDEAEETLKKLRAHFDYKTAQRSAAEAINSSAASNNPSSQTPLLNQTSFSGSVASQSHVAGATSGLDGYDLDHLHSSNPEEHHHLSLNLEFQELRNQVKSSQSSGELSWSQIFVARYRTQILMGTCLMMSSALVGINAVTMFTTKIFGFAGLEGDKAIYGTMAAALTSFGSSFISMMTIERLGRRTLFICGAVGCLVSVIALSVSLLALNDHKSAQGIIAVVAVIGYILSYNFGLGGVPWALLPEITASEVRSKLQSLFCFENWVGNFAIVLSTLPLVNLLGGGDSDAQQKKGAAILFLLYGGFILLALVFGMTFLIETKGLSEAQVQLKLGNAAPLEQSTDDNYYSNPQSYLL